tara:strand:- start:4 stop:384 length:381 start_codon:yes stop_codon:yes gene_type:complete
MSRPRIYTDEQRKQKKKEWREANREKEKERLKKYRDENKEKEKERLKKYRSTENGIKSYRISKWKYRGMIHDDFDSVYEIYFHTWNCEYCGCEFKNTKDRCLDHNHETGEVRAILCNRCNVLDVLK